MQITGRTTQTVEVPLATIYPQVAAEVLRHSGVLDGVRKYDSVFERDGKLMGYVDYGHHRGGDETTELSLPEETDRLIRALLTIGAVFSLKSIKPTP